MISEHLRVLYAEKDEDACFLLSTALKLSDIEVTSAGTITEACRLGRTEPFDLYLLDDKFSDGSGLDLCRCLRQHSPKMPILFYSGHAFKIDEQNGLAAGADAYLVKPYFDKVVEKILQIMEPLRHQAALN